MNPYLITQTINLSPSAYRAAVVACEYAEVARRLHPGGSFFNRGAWWDGEHHTGRPEIDRSGFWVKPEFVKVEWIGTTMVGMAYEGAAPVATTFFAPGTIVCARTAEVGEHEETFAEPARRGGLMDVLASDNRLDEPSATELPG